MVTILDSAIRSTIYETIYDLINTDKATYGASAIPTLYGGYPDVASITYPNIIILPVSVDEGEFTVDTTRNSTTKTINVTVEVYAKKNKDLDFLADGVSATIRDNTFSGAFLTAVNEGTNFLFPNDQKVKSKNLTFTFVRR